MRIGPHDLPIRQSVMDIEGRFIIQYTRTTWVMVVRVRTGIKTQYEMIIEHAGTEAGFVYLWRGWKNVRSLDEVNRLLIQLCQMRGYV